MNKEVKCKYLSECADAQKRCDLCENNTNRNTIVTFFKAHKDSEAKRGINGRYKVANNRYLGPHDGSEWECPLCHSVHNGYAAPGDNPTCPSCGAPCSL